MSVHKLYNGSVTLKFDGRRHVYTYEEEKTADGTPLMIAGVTSILKRLSKDALIPWASNMAAEYFKNALIDGFDIDDTESSVTWTIAEIVAIYNDARRAYARKTREAADVGKLVHSYVEAFLKGDRNPEQPKKALNPEEKTQHENGIEAFKKWFVDHDVKVIASERVLFSKRWKYAGTTDLVAVINGRKGVFDVKTSSGLYPEMDIQIAAYRIALEEEDDEVYPWGGLIHLDKNTGHYTMKWLPRNKQDEDCFLGLREVDEIMKRKERSQ